MCRGTDGFGAMGDEMSAFWTSSHKYQLIDWLTGRYPQDGGKFRRMSKRQLYAVYYRCRKK